MRTRVAALALLGLLLLSVAGGARRQLEKTAGPRIPASLLFLPKGPYLRALAVGHEDLLADLLYIWAIQYYSNYEDQARYEYLDAVFRGAITELDPLFRDAYVVGALIMSIEARRAGLALTLFDKGIDNMPGDWELGFAAGWEAYLAGRFDKARSYWLRAATARDAPVDLKRLAAKMLEKLGDRKSAIAEYERLLSTETDDRTRRIVASWLERLQTEQALADVDAAIAAFKARHGRCPAALDALVREGFLSAVPEGPNGAAFHYDRANCRALPAPRQSFEGGS